MSDENNGGTVEKLDASDAAGKAKRQRSSIAFPYMDLNEAVNLARAIYNNVATNSCTVEQLAPWMKQSSTSSAFRNRLGAARLFGWRTLIAPDAIRLTEIGRMVVDPLREREGRARAFLASCSPRCTTSLRAGMSLRPQPSKRNWLHLELLGHAQRNGAPCHGAFGRAKQDFMNLAEIGWFCLGLFRRESRLKPMLSTLVIAGVVVAMEVVEGSISIWTLCWSSC